MLFKWDDNFLAGIFSAGKIWVYLAGTRNKIVISNLQSIMGFRVKLLERK